VLTSIAVAAFTGRFQELTRELVAGAQTAVELTLKLVGVMALFLGLMNVAREGGLLAWVARRMGPLLRRLFPDVPADHPAMSAMIMNLASNVLGLGNAATPFGLKAMTELDKLNTRPGVATDAMALFLAINATSVTLLPTGVIAVRAAAGSESPAAIFVPTLVATIASTATGIAVCLLMRRWWPLWPRADAAAPAPAPSAPEPPAASAEPPPAPREPMTRGARLLVLGFALLLGAAFARRAAESFAAGTPGAFAEEVASHWLLPVLVAFFVLVGVAGRVKVYESTVAGAREALDVGVRIVPFLVAILSAVAMFRASGALDFLIRLLQPATEAVGVPAEALPMILLRPLSGSGAFAVLLDTLKTHGADSFVGMLVSTLQGSTETTFYVLAVYFGAAGVRAGRYTLAACLAGDLAGFAAATAMCHLFFD
jgi:spore maturation protein SpmA